MVLPLLASAADLTTAGATGTAEQMELALRRASARVRSYTRQVISFVANETIEIPGGERVLRVPQRPLVVDATHLLTVVELDGFGGIEVPAIEGRDFSRLGNELTRGYPYYAPTRTMGWPWRQQLGVWAPRVRLIYSHGDEEIPDDIVDIVLDLAMKNLSNPEMLRTVAIDDYSRTYASETIGNATLSRDQKADLRPYRRPAFSVISS